MSEYDRKSEIRAFDDTKAGVEGLTRAGVEKIPRIFVNEQYLHENKSTPNDKSSRSFSIPVIDLQNNDPTARGEIVGRVKQACEEWGFFQVVNHGISSGIANGVLDGVKKFHEGDGEVKRRYYSRDFGEKVIYNSNYDLHQAKSANWRDTLYLNFCSSPPEPEELPQVCRNIIIEYLKQAKELGVNLLELLSEALGVGKNRLKEMGCANGILVAAHYYPGCPEPDLTMGLSTHTDSGYLTILLQDQIGGLQVLYKDQWVDVPCHPGALIVNIGDLMELITNAKFKSVYHRVLANSSGPRVSVAFFFRMSVRENNNSKMYGPIKELLSDENPPIYREVTWEEINSCRRNNSLDVPLLSHFKLNTSPPNE